MRKATAMIALCYDDDGDDDGDGNVNAFVDIISELSSPRKNLFVYHHAKPVKSDDSIVINRSLSGHTLLTFVHL